MGMQVEFNGEMRDMPEMIEQQIGLSYTQEQAVDASIKAFESLYSEQKPEEGSEDAPAPDAAPTAPAEEQKNEDDGSEAPVEVNYFEKKGFSSEEEFDNAVARLKAIDAREAALAEKERVYSELENPYVDEEDAKVAKFKKETGLTGSLGMDAAKATLLTPIKDIQENPVLAMAISEIINNPKKLNHFSIQDIIEKEQRKAEKLGVDFNDTTSAEYKDYAMDAYAAVDRIQEYREKFGTSKSSFESLLSTRQEQDKIFANKLESFKSNVDNIGLKELKHEFDGKELVWETPKKILEQIPDAMLNSLAERHDLNTTDGKKLASEEISRYLIAKKAIEGTLAKDAYQKGVSDTKAAAEREAIKLKVNGGQKVLDRNGKSVVSTQSAIANEINAAYGITD